MCLLNQLIFFFFFFLADCIAHMFDWKCIFVDHIQVYFFVYKITRRGDRGRLQHFFLIDHITFITQERQPKLISSERVICQLDFHQALMFQTHTYSFRAVNVLKQGVKCCNMPHIMGSVATLPGDNCNTMSQIIHWEQWGQLQHLCLIDYIVTLLLIEGNQS